MAKIRSTVESAVRTEAEADPAFRAALLADPMRAIQDRFGVGAIADLRISVIEEQPSEIVLILPSDQRPPLLTEAELDATAGGTLYNTDNCPG